MHNWKNELQNLDTSENQLHYLDLAHEAFITSPYADNQKTRIGVYLLFQHLKKLF